MIYYGIIVRSFYDFFHYNLKQQKCGPLSTIEMNLLYKLMATF